jgi:hypothetical protein
VEETLQYCLLQAHKETDDKFEQIETSLNQHLERGKEEIRKYHQSIMEGGENQNPQTSSATLNGEPTSTKGKALTTINVEIKGGQYAGNTYQLVPKPRYPCWVGRSQGKKFRERGISMPKDLEISTTHGKFEVKQGKLYYTDTGSTNGSKVGGEEIAPDTPRLLEDGMELTLGQSTLVISLC